MVGDLPRRHRHRQQADTRQLQVDQVADVLHRADLGLLREVPAQALAGDVGAHHQDEAGVVDQAAVAEHRDVHAVGLLDDRDGDRLGVDHRRQRLAQGEHHRGEAGGQVVVVVHRVLLGTPLAGGEGTELAGQGHQFAVQLLRVQRAHAGQVTGEGLGAVDQLQQQEVGDFRGAPGAGCHHPPGEGFAALVEQAQQLLGEGRQGRRGGNVEYRRQVVLVQAQGLVRALLADPRDAHRGVFAEAVALGQQAERLAAQGHRGAALEGGIVVAHFLHLADVAGAAEGLALLYRVAGADPLQRQAEVDDAIAQAFLDIQRRRRRIVGGDVERRTIRQHAAGADDGQLALGQQGIVQLQLGKAPAARQERAAAAIHQGFQVAVVLLEMLWPQEHAFGPHHAVIPGHRDSEGSGRGTRDDADGLRAERDVEMAGALPRHGEDLAPGGAVEVAVGGDETELAGLLVERAFDAPFLARTQEELVLLHQVAAEGRLGVVGEGEVVGAAERGVFLQLVQPQAQRRRLAGGGRVEVRCGVEPDHHPGRRGFRRAEQAASSSPNSATISFCMVSSSLTLFLLVFVGVRNAVVERCVPRRRG